MLVENIKLRRYDLSNTGQVTPVNTRRLYHVTSP